MLTNVASTTIAFSKAKVLFMAAGFLLVLSVSLGSAAKQGIFVGLWVPAIHSLGALVLTNDRSAQ